MLSGIGGQGVQLAAQVLARAAMREGRFVLLFGSYGGTKAAAEALVRSWAAESARIGPKVLLFHPNPMPTALRARFFPGEDGAALTPCVDEATRLLEMLAASGE